MAGEEKLEQYWRRNFDSLKVLQSKEKESKLFIYFFSDINFPASAIV